MPVQEVLIMAMTHMLSGVCTAGFTRQPHPITHYTWVRPVKEHGSLLLGDLTDPEGRVLQCGDVVELHLLRHRPDPPHAEDWTCEFIYQRPRVLRRLEGERRARFLAGHLDRAPGEVLGPKPSRSLCLVRPDRIWATFALDPYSHKYQARLGFTVEGAPHHQANSARGIPVTDIKWRALGRSWIGNGGGELTLDEAILKRRLDVDEMFLALGLSRSYEGTTWLLVIGVHPVPDYQVEVDYSNL
jgi:hypothetical protein